MAPRLTVVTGAASGIGQALAQSLRAQGQRVIGVDIRDAEILCDLSDPAQRSELPARIEKASGGTVDGVAAVAAVAGLAAPSPLTASVNYFGAVSVLRSLRPALARSSSPRAAVVASLAAVEPHDQALLAAFEADDEQLALARAAAVADATNPSGSSVIYTTSKRAVASWVRRSAVQDDWAGAGIALNAVAPGVVQTPMMAAALATEEGRAAIAAVLPSPLNGPAPAAAPAALLGWLLSEANTHVTGQVIFVDGGTEALFRPDSF